MNEAQKIVEAFLKELPRYRSSAESNLLQTLFDVATGQGGTQQKQAKRLRAFIEFSLQTENACLSHGFPTSSNTPFCVADRLIWMPRGIPNLHRTGFVSSRLGKSPDKFLGWFDTVRTICARLEPTNDAIVCTHDTAGFDFYHRAAWLFGLPRIEMRIASNTKSFEKWLINLPETVQEDESDKDNYPIFVSPPFSEVASSEAMGNRDEMHAMACETIYALRVTANGNTHTSLRKRCIAKEHQPGSVLISSAGDAIPENVRDDLQRCGALQHLLLTPVESSSNQKIATSGTTETALENRGNQILALDDLLPRIEGWLSHCTRKRIGPWPDEDWLTYLDDLLFRRFGSNHTAIAAICRIVHTQRIVATADLIRGNTAVVSLSANSLPDLLASRTFRSHLSRWDFEPYGICVNRDALSDLGAKPVIYAVDSKYTHLPESEKPFFQKNSSSNDWTLEREWRLVGDLQLQRIDAKNAIVFVPSKEEAAFVSRFTRFDVCVV